VITVKVEITCDSCGRVFLSTGKMDYRTTGAAPVTVTKANSLGWRFVRDENHKLERVYCPKCAVAAFGYTL
jgi:hypothetical protein